MASENRIVPVVLCGGTGSRLWPLSRDGHPKQFLRLLGNHTLLQDTLLRVRGIDGVGAPILVSNEAHRFVVAEQAREIGCEPAAILLEPHARNTAPAAAVAALKAQAGGDDPILLVLPSDHLVRDHAAFARSVAAASAGAAAGAIATLGVVPTFPATGYGYIKAVPTNDTGLMTVKRFVEKPSLEQATDFLGEGNCYWNSGMFLFRASVYLEALRQFAPEILRAAEQAVARGKSDLDFCRLDADAFGACPSDSIDYAVMEHLRDARMAPLAADWSDIGSWDAVWKAADKTEDNNAAIGNVVTHGARDCLVHASHRMVAVAGLDSVIVVETPDVVLVVHKDHAQDVKQLVEALRAQGRSEATQHRQIYRPWGSYDCVDHGQRYQVKRISVKPGAKLSLQKHHHRAEHWVVVSGTARVRRGDVEFLLTEDQSTYIPIGETHSLENPGRIPLELIEIQSGSYLGEDDIIRMADIYGRT
ncbi:mannose-1-phosphate guanylyltransferase/mannose-6-phosphate isomerase [Cupriavidus gilardii]|uniref:mannose-1-phosphate guanylyltransferase/mannose-6-phosphate isomerase n=1 Tax=Cupriavidus gilardii TaxID=82541 RepID=UPI0015804BFB|nr:mannose-1-phosphate guanylyltransferase/mannose-6-phosphate isomerase [Cupriavidus gilardii]MCT9069877.1 mannose-1-phosphate guanylyltransferase/mannose-6-phosphate isomerase [Cupriavidus gilardii]MCT9117624.1 mannose-1-phosphate guanylyltransferase/mannose-6-phosphate isomerase [Cupriavidus gilardii]QKS62116.1 mannose-1-phosphate guanylyltransferase/mannose-6-phosphate isomerase [Cupriavidus gilardii]UXC37940.1 mannose-1-phosphate guanylyltransferase/mannose-6-phosphate isomerase [Cupriavid